LSIDAATMPTAVPGACAVSLPLSEPLPEQAAVARKRARRIDRFITGPFGTPISGEAGL
jgi:hypothetical protein